MYPEKFLQPPVYFLGGKKGRTISRDSLFGSSLRLGIDKAHLTAFRGAMLREAYRPEDLVDGTDVPLYGSCGETIPFICNLAQ